MTGDLGDLDNLSLEAWRQLWPAIGKQEADRPWIYGELFNAGRRFVEKDKDEEEAHQLVAGMIPNLGECGLTVRHLKQFGWVASAFPRARRHPKLSWTHHREVWAAGVPAKERRRWLSAAAEKGWTTRDLRVHMAPGGRSEPMNPCPVKFVARRWADLGVIGLRELFPINGPIDPALQESVRRELGGLLQELKRVQILP